MCVCEVNPLVTVPYIITSLLHLHPEGNAFTGNIYLARIFEPNEILYQSIKLIIVYKLLTFLSGHIFRKILYFKPESENEIKFKNDKLRCTQLSQLFHKI